jgi:uncharacterized protein YndB with AHSA1/START domain
MTTENQVAIRRPVTAQLKSAADARAITDGDIVLATVDVAATPERVFRALTTDEAERWWGRAWRLHHRGLESGRARRRRLESAHPSAGRERTAGER